MTARYYCPQYGTMVDDHYRCEWSGNDIRGPLSEYPTCPSCGAKVIDRDAHPPAPDLEAIEAALARLREWTAYYPLRSQPSLGGGVELYYRDDAGNCGSVAEVRHARDAARIMDALSLVGPLLATIRSLRSEVAAWQSATYSPTPDALSRYVANAARESVAQRDEIASLRSDLATARAVAGEALDALDEAASHDDDNVAGSIKVTLGGRRVYLLDCADSVVRLRTRLTAGPGEGG